MRLPSRASRLALSVVLLGSLLCCEFDEAAALDGRVFALQSAEGFRPVDGTTAQLAFQHGQLSLSAGCNNLFGGFEIRDSRLIVDELGVTELGCDSALEAQDKWLESFLSAEPRVTLTNNQLTLEGALAKLAFVSSEVEEPELVGTVWSVDTFLKGTEASNFFLNPGPTVEFTKDESVRIDTTCSTATGSYAVGKDWVTVANLTFSSGTCTGAAKSADAHLRTLFRAGKLTFEIQAGRLTLGTSALGISATVGKAAAQPASSPAVGKK